MGFGEEIGIVEIKIHTFSWALIFYYFVFYRFWQVCASTLQPVGMSLDLDMLKDIPGYKAIMKSVLKSQIQLLVSLDLIVELQAKVFLKLKKK